MRIKMPRMVRVRERYEEHLLHFFSMSGRLKSEPRRGWIQKLQVKKAESVADHCYRVALMTMVYSDLKGFDTARALKLAILHDLPEAIVGDATPKQVPRLQRVREENLAMTSLLKHLPERLSSKYEDLWRDFIEGTSNEANLVRQLDKLEMALQATEYAKENYLARAAKQFIKSAHRSITDSDLKRLLDVIKRASPPRRTR